MPKLIKPAKASILYEDKKTYACLASEPFAKGHVVIVWKRAAPDIHALSCKDYDHLMNVLDLVRDAMLKFFKVDKVYVFYLDEIRHVHWHLLPRFKTQGFKIVLHKSPIKPDFDISPALRVHIAQALKGHPEI